MIGILIVARLGSSRLAAKHLIKYNNKTFIEHLVNRIGYTLKDEIEKGICQIIIATGSKDENFKFSEILFEYPVTVFYGNDSNVPRRQLDCGHELNLDAIISVDGDDLLISNEALKDIYKKLKDGHDILKTANLPLGMNVMGYSVKFLDAILNNLKDQKVVETGWGRIFENSLIETVKFEPVFSDERLRYTLDYPEDAAFFQAVFENLGKHLYSADYNAINTIVLKKDLLSINGSLNLEYWQNFNAAMKKEQDNLD